MNLIKLLSKKKKLEGYISSLVGNDVYSSLSTWAKRKLKTYIAAIAFNDIGSAEIILDNIVDNVFDDLIAYNLFEFCKLKGTVSVKAESPFTYRNSEGKTVFAPAPVGEIHYTTILDTVQKEYLELYFNETFGDKNLKEKLVKIPNFKREEKLRAFSQIIELKILNKK